MGRAPYFRRCHLPSTPFSGAKNVFQGRARQFTGLRIQQPDLSEKTAEQQDGAQPRWVGMMGPPAWRVGF